MIAPWRSLQALTPDATQLADPSWRPTPFSPAGARGGVAPKWQQAADWAKQGRINNLSLMALDVLMAPHDAKDRSCSFIQLVQNMRSLRLCCDGTASCGCCCYACLVLDVLNNRFVYQAKAMVALHWSCTMSEEVHIEHFEGGHAEVQYACRNQAICKPSCQQAKQ